MSIFVTIIKCSDVVADDEKRDPEYEREPCDWWDYAKSSEHAEGEPCPLCGKRLVVITEDAE